MTTATIRKDDSVTTAQVKDQIRAEATDLTSTTVGLHNVEFRLSDELPSFVVGDVQIPATTKGIQAFGDFFGIPSPFFKRIGKDIGLDLQGVLLDKMSLAYKGSSITVKHSEADVRGVFEPDHEPIDPIRLVTVAENVLGTTEGVVQRLVNESGEFSFDVHVPFDYGRGVGGDGTQVDLPDALQGVSWVPARGGTTSNQIGDVTAGGLRFGVDLKRGLAPWVQPWMMRLVCTNGMSANDPGLKVDARGQSVEEVLAEIEAQAQRAFSRVEAQIEHFYRLRQQKVANPERALRAIAREHGIPDRSMVHLMDQAAGSGLPDDVSMFDLVNLVTNLANSPMIKNDGGRLLLENAGGAIISEESTRCAHCLQKTD